MVVGGVGALQQRHRLCSACGIEVAQCHDVHSGQRNPVR
jgi:hypothetical protein